MKERIEPSAIQQREDEKERWPIEFQPGIQQRQQLRDGLKPDINLNTLLCMKTAGSPSANGPGLHWYPFT